MSKMAVYLYFAYGSNLLASRMHVDNPMATRAGVGYLPDHRLDFNFHSKRWGGPAATIVPDVGRTVWGALWQINDIESLDRQEGVPQGIYIPKQVLVHKLNNETQEARTYQMVNLPQLGENKKPSRIYLETVIQGALETGLPSDYIAELKRIDHNGFEGPSTVPGLNITFVHTTKISH